MSVYPSPPGGARTRLRDRCLRILFAALIGAAGLQLLLRLVASVGMDQATRCVQMAGRLAQAGITLAIVSVSPDCPAESVTPGGDASHLIAWGIAGLLSVGVVYVGTSAWAQRACRFVRALASGDGWRVLLAMTETPAIPRVRRTSGERGPARRPRPVRHASCGVRGPPALV